MVRIKSSSTHDKEMNSLIDRLQKELLSVRKRMLKNNKRQLVI